MFRQVLLAIGLVSVAMQSESQAQALDVIEQANRYTIKIITAVDYPFGSEKKAHPAGWAFLSTNSVAGF